MGISRSLVFLLFNAQILTFFEVLLFQNFSHLILYIKLTMGALQGSFTESVCTIVSGELESDSVEIREIQRQFCEQEDDDTT